MYRYEILKAIGSAYVFETPTLLFTLISAL